VSNAIRVSLSKREIPSLRLERPLHTPKLSSEKNVVWRRVALGFLRYPNLQSFVVDTLYFFYFSDFLHILMQRSITACGYALALCLTFLYSTPVFASGRQALMQFTTEVQAAKGQFVQRQVTAKPRTATSKASDGAATRPALASVPAEQILKGYFVFKRPGQFIWAITQPYAQTLQADGQDFYIYDQDLQQVTHRAFDEAISGSSAAVLFGRGDWQRTFTLRDEGIQQGIDWVELRPKQEDSSFVQIRIGFRNGMLSSMEVQDTFGNTTYFTFHHLEINPTLPKNQFTFHLPAGADLVEG
jgi:outer membrane lipoprotein carrier protein